MAERTVQFNVFFMVDMIKQNGLIHGYPPENWKDGIEERGRLKPIAIVGNDGEDEKEENKNKEGDFPFHASLSILNRRQICQEKI
jgi:hypothetical protein